MSRKPFTQKLTNMPVPILPTMVGAATLSNMYLTLGYTWIRHITMWAAAIIVICFLFRIILHFDGVKKEYANTIPASLYAGLTMMIMILGSYIFDYSPGIGKTLWFIGLGFHALHLILFIYRNVIKNFNQDTFVPTWFVTFNGIMVSTVVGGVMNEPAIGTFIVYYGIAIFAITMPFMILRLAKKPLPEPLAPSKVILLAPSSLCLVSYLNFIKTPQPIVIYTLYIIILCTLIFIALNVPSIFSAAFHPGFAGVTFPMAIGIVASSKMAGYLTNQGYAVLGTIVKEIAGIQLYVTTAFIGFVIYNFARMFARSYKPQQPN